MMNKHLLIVLSISLASLFATWMPFFFHSQTILGVDFEGVGVERIVQNFDGLNFLVVAKTWYDPDKISSDYQDILAGRKPLYFSAHYPGLPIMIASFDIFLSGPNALLAAIMMSNLLLAYGLYAFFLLFTSKPKVAMWLTLFSLFFPARILADRMVGSNEPLFMFFVLMSLTLHEKGKNWSSALMGGLAVLTRSPGIILYGAYMIGIWIMNDKSIKEKIKLSIPYLLIPLMLLMLFVFYGFQFGSFWAYFQVGGNINLYWPFAVFASHMDWVSGMWNEDLIYLFTLISSGIFLFFQKNKWRSTTIFGILYAIFVVSVAHRDLSRYSLPIMPIVLLGISPLLEHKLAKIVGLIMIVPIVLYAWQFVLSNYQPVMDWTRFL